jgi:biotin carboxylase
VAPAAGSVHPRAGRAPLLLVAGAGPWQVPTIVRAKALGLRVLAADMLDERPGYAWADLRAKVDISDGDAVLEAARRHGAAGVLCDTTDTGVVAAAYAAEALGLPGNGVEVTLRCTDKARMTTCAAAAGLAVPRSQRAERIDQAWPLAASLGYPLVVKPVDNQSGRGVALVGTETAFADAFASALAFSRSGAVLLQGVIQGVEIIVDSLVIDGRVIRLGLACKRPSADNPTVATRITYDLSGLPAPIERIDAVNAALLAALGVRQGPVHAEYIVRAGQVIPIDVAVRGGGVMIYSHVLPHVSGVDVIAATIALALGRRPRVDTSRGGGAANIEFLRGREGTVTAVEGVEAARCVPGVAAVHLQAGVGDHLIRPAHKDHRPGFVVGFGRTGEEAIRSSCLAAQMISLRCEPVGQSAAPVANS